MPCGRLSGDQLTVQAAATHMDVMRHKCLGVRAPVATAAIVVVECWMERVKNSVTPSIHSERETHALRAPRCAPRVRFYQPFPAFFTFFQGGKDAVA